MLDTSGMYMPRDSMGYSTTRSDSEMAIYWSVPTCMGIQLLPEVGSSSNQRIAENREGYKELQSMIAERQKDVKDTYGLNGLTQPEFYMKTTGENAVEMTDHFYNGFNDRGKELIKEFFPFIAENYGW